MSFNQNVTKALNAIDTARKAHTDYLAVLESLRKDCAGLSPDAVRQRLIKLVGQHYDVAVKDGERKAKGTKVFDSEAVHYEAAKVSLRGLVNDIAGTVSKRAEPVAVPKALVNGIVKSIIDAKLSRKQLSALLAEVRDAVDFE